MQFRLRSLLTQFSLRDLFWLFLLAAAVSYAYQNQRAMELMQLEVAQKEAVLDVAIQNNRQVAKNDLAKREKFFRDKQELERLAKRLEESIRQKPDESTIRELIEDLKPLASPKRNEASGSFSPLP